MKHALTVKQSVLYTDLSVIGNRRSYFRSVLEIDYEFTNYRYTNGRLSWNFDADIEYNRAFLRGRSLNDAVESFIEAMRRESENLGVAAGEVTLYSALHSLDARALGNLLERYTDAYLRTMPALFMFWNTERMLLKQLENVDLPLIYGDSGVDGAVQEILVAPRPNYITLEREHLLEIGIALCARPPLAELVLEASFDKAESELPNHAEVKRMIEDHVRRFAFSTTAFHLNPPLTERGVIERLSGIIGSDSAAALADERRRKAEQARLSDERVAELASFPDIARRADMARRLLYWKNQRIDTQFRCDFEVRPLFEEIARRIGLTLHELVSLRYEELVDWLRQERADMQVLGERQLGYSYWLTDGRVEVSAAREEPSPDAVAFAGREVKGDVANPGKAQGRVKIVLAIEDMGKVRKGDILVAPMTRPEMVAALERAAAFVTDEGGRLCHAAIVSREMNKPCITGTECATKVLRDDQLVLVDADAGVVRIIDAPGE